MQQFLIGVFVILTPSVLFLAWLVWRASILKQRRRFSVGLTDVIDRD